MKNLFLRIYRSFLVSVTVLISLFGGWISHAQQQCLYPATNFLSWQVIDLKDKTGILSELEDYFEKEYLVVDMSLERCEHCKNFAIARNSDLDFQSRVSGNSSCRFVSLVESGTVIQWLGKIGWPASFMGARSREVVDAETSYNNVPTVYGWPPITSVPTFWILNRAGEVVTTRQWALPDLFYELCLPNSCYGSWHDNNTCGGNWSCGNGTGNTEVWTWWSCGWGWWTTPWWTTPWWTTPWWTTPWWTTPWWTTPWWTTPWWTTPWW